MLQPNGRALLTTGLCLVGAGVVLGVSSAVLAGALLLGLLRLELARLQADLPDHGAPWGVRARLRLRDGSESTDRTLRVGRRLPLVLQVQVPPRHLGARLDIDQWWTSPGLPPPAEATLRLDLGSQDLYLQVTPPSAAVHRVLGLQGRLTDTAGLITVPVFLPAPCELAVLPRSLPLDLRAVAETRRRSPRSGMGDKPDRVPGSGNDLRELREHLPGDPFKHIAWKASAARGRLMSRSFEREQTRALYVVLETGATMRDGVPGRGALDQALDLVHSLAEACAKSHDPFGLSLVDGHVLESRPVLEGLAAVGSTDRALLDLRRAVAEELAPMREQAIVELVGRYLTAVERVPLPELAHLHNAPAAERPQLYAFARQRVVMAALARLPERERLPLLRGPEPASRADLSILRRFCRAMDLALPYRGALPAGQRVAGLVSGVRAAMGARKGPFALVVVSDFRGLSGQLQPLLAAFAAAREAGHRVLAVAVRELDGGDTTDLLAQSEDTDAALGLLRADQAARQLLLRELEDGCRRAGAAFVGDANPKEIVALWRHG